METRLLSCPPSAEDKDVSVTEAPVSLDQIVPQVSDPAFGAVVTFAGCVRNKEKGLGIRAITYEAYQAMAEKEIRKIVRIARKRWNVAAAVRHRIGRVALGEPSLLVACAGIHRQETFHACAFIVDEIKKQVPVWKVGYEWIIP